MSLRTIFTCTLLALLVHVGLSLDSDSDLDPGPESGLWPWALKGRSERSRPTAQRLLGELQEVLEKLQAKRLPHWKKYGQVPTCDLGQLCAVRKGARIGKLCDCPQGALCSYFLLKCL